MGVSVIGYCCWGRCLMPLPIELQERGHTGGDCAGTRSEQLDYNTPVLRSDEGGSNARDREEHEDQGPPGVQQPSETAPEPASGGDQGVGDADDPVQPGKPRGVSRCSSYIIVYINRY